MGPRARPVLYRSFSFVPFFVLSIVLSLAVSGCGSGGESESSTALPSYCPVSSLSAGLPQSVGNDPPIAYRQQIYTDDDTASDVTLYACDPDQPMTSNGLSWVVDSAPTVGSVTALGGDYHDPVIQYIPRPGFTGTDSFYYSVSDGEDASATKEIRVHIQANKVLLGLELTPPSFANLVQPMSVGEPSQPTNSTFLAVANYDNGVSIDVSDLVQWVVTIVVEPEGSAQPMGVEEGFTPDPQSIEDIMDMLNNYHGPPLDVDVTAWYRYGGIGLFSSVMLVVGDVTPPDLVPPGDVTVEATGPLTDVELGVAIANDPEEGAVVATSDAPAGFPVGTTHVIWTASDSKGNIATEEQLVTVVDTSPPSITSDPGSLELPPPSDLTIEATGAQTEVSLSGITAVDAVDGTVTVSSVPPAPFVLSMGITSITWTATDSRENSASVVQNITVVDTTPPTLDIPAAVVAEATGVETPVDHGSATATDIVDGVLYPSSNAPAMFPLGETSITWSVYDQAGNTSSGIQLVTVEDTSPPVIDTVDGDPEITPPPDITAEASGASTLVDIGTALGWDLVDGAVTVSNNAPDVFPVGITVVVWTAADSAGNQATVEQVITVEDTTPPDIVAPPDVTVTSSGSAVVVELGTAAATDMVDGDVPVSCNAPDEFEPGTTTVTWNAEDTAGNTASATQLVNVVTVTVVTDLEYTGDQVVTIHDDYLYLQATLYPEEGQIPFDDPENGTTVWFHIYTFDQMPMPGGVGAYLSVGPQDVSESLLHPGVGVAGYSMSLPAELGTNEENYKVLVELGEGNPVSGLSQEATLTVYAPTDRFFTGGGTIADPLSGEENNFGFTIKFLDNQGGVPEPKGNVLYVRQDSSSGYKWRVLSESLEAAGFYPYGTEGGTVAITEGLCRVESHDLITGGDAIVQSGLDCVMKVEDLDTSGISADTFRLELRYLDGVPFWPIHMEEKELLTGGNVMVHE